MMAPLLAGVFGALTPVKEITLSHLVTAVYVGITLSLCQAAGQCLNQYADVELDKVVKPYRPLPSGLVTRDEALGLSWLLAIFATGRGFTISTFFGLTVLTLLFFAVFYSLTPFSPRRIHPVLNTGWMAFSRGFLPVMAVWSVYGDMGQAWQYALLAFTWVMGFQASKDVPDVEGDREYGIKTIPNTWGVNGLLTTMTVCVGTFTLLSTIFNTPFMLILLPLGVAAMITVKKQATLIENTYSWCAFYLGLGLLYILMFIGERFIL